MLMEELLNRIEDNTIEDGAMFSGGDFFYPLIVIDKDLYVMNTIKKEFTLLSSSYIGKSIKKRHKFNEYKQILS